LRGSIAEQVAGEPPHGHQALRWVAARGVEVRVEHEGQGVGDRDEAGTGIVEPGDEAGELALVLVELVAEGSAQAEIVAKGCLQSVHRTTSQGRASSRSAV
jgi:hypothetical protein